MPMAVGRRSDSIGGPLSLQQRIDWIQQLEASEKPVFPFVSDYLKNGFAGDIFRRQLDTGASGHFFWNTVCPSPNKHAKNTKTNASIIRSRTYLIGISFTVRISSIYSYEIVIKHFPSFSGSNIYFKQRFSFSGRLYCDETKQSE